MKETITASRILDAQVGMLSHFQIRTISFIFLVTSILSLVGSGSIIFVCIRKRKVCNDMVLPLFQLCLADFLGSLSLIIGILYYHLQNTPSNNAGCLIITMLATSFFMTTFLLTANYAAGAYREVSNKLATVTVLADVAPVVNIQSDRRKRSTGTVLSVISWILPLTVGMVVMFSDTPTYHGRFRLNDDICSCCFPLFVYENRFCQHNRSLMYTTTDERDDDKFNWYTVYKYVFVLGLLLSLFLILLLYYITYYKYKQVLESGGVIGITQYLLCEKVRRRSAFFAAAFLFSWFFTLILGFISLSPHFKMDNFYALYIIQACTSPLQGFLNSLVYGWNRKQFRNTINERTALLSSVE